MLLIVPAALACEPFDLQAVLHDVDAAIDSGAPGEASERMEAAWNALPDACQALVPADLGTLAWTAAGHAAILHRPDEAKNWARFACTMAPSFSPPAGNTLAAEVCAEVAAQPRSRVHAESAILVDGVPVAAGQAADLVIGQHVVQWEVAGQWSGRRFTLEEGVSLGQPSGDSWTEPPPVTQPKRSIALPVVMLGAGGVAAATGGVVLQGFADAWTAGCSDDYEYRTDGWRSCQEERGVPLGTRFYGGVGLIAGGIALGVGGLGFGLPVLFSTDGSRLVVSGRF